MRKRALRPPAACRASLLLKDITMAPLNQIDAAVAAAIGRERRNNRIQLAVVSLGLLLVQAAFSGGAPSAVGSSGGA